jgi:GT2 family glycosyltransferase
MSQNPRCRLGNDLTCGFVEFPHADISHTDNQSASLVYIVVLNWNGKEDTLECLQSISFIYFPGLQVVVVDNGSDDGSTIAIRENFPTVTILETGENLGYAGGNNVGIQYALENDADYVLVLNNDTVVDPQVVRAFVDAALSLPEGGIFCGKIYFYSDPTRLYSTGATFSKEKMDFVVPAMGKFDNSDGDFDTVKETDIAVGCALFATREVLEKVGVFDERFFLVHEESDLCYRAMRAGYKVFFIPQAKLWHKGSVSFDGSDSPLMHYFWARNRLLWAEHHLSLLNRFRLYGRVLSELITAILPKRVTTRSTPISFDKQALWALATWSKTLKRSLRAPVFKAELYGLCDYFFRKFGDCPPKVRALRQSKKKT